MPKEALKRNLTPMGMRGFTYKERGLNKLVSKHAEAQQIELFKQELEQYD